VAQRNVVPQGNPCCHHGSWRRGKDNFGKDRKALRGRTPTRGLPFRKNQSVASTGESADERLVTSEDGIVRMASVCGCPLGVKKGDHVCWDSEDV
jgi:hypothetical protein